MIQLVKKLVTYDFMKEKKKYDDQNDFKFYGGPDQEVLSIRGKFSIDCVIESWGGGGGDQVF